MQLIAVVGRGMKSARELQQFLVSGVQLNARVNIKMIDQGSSELNIIVGVEEEDFEVAIKAIYKRFIGINQ